MEDPEAAEGEHLSANVYGLRQEWVGTWGDSEAGAAAGTGSRSPVGLVEMCGHFLSTY